MLIPQNNLVHDHQGWVVQNNKIYVIPIGVIKLNDYVISFTELFHFISFVIRAPFAHLNLHVM
jgi:hypothetical protein